MKTTLSEPSSTERVLEIEIPRERFDRIFNERVKKYSRELRLKGFRPGSIPKQVVVSRFKQPISTESLEALVEEAVREACQEHKIEPVGPGKIEKLENEPEHPIMVKAVLEVDPQIDIKGYPVSIPVPEPEVPEGVVEEQIQRFRRRLAEEKQVERPARNGDVVVAEYLSMVIDGQVQTLPENREFRAELGAGGLPEFDRQLEGAVAGEEREVRADFPPDYPQPQMAGKSSVYRFKILEVNEQVLPEPDDEFALKLGQESIEVLKSRIREDLKAQAVRQTKDQVYEQAIHRLIEENPFEVPKSRIHKYVHYRMEQVGHGHDHDREGEHAHPPELEREAERVLKRYRILEEIARKEKIKASPEEVDRRIREMADQYATDFESLKAALRRNGKIIDIREDIKTRKTLDFIIGAQPAAA